MSAPLLAISNLSVSFGPTNARTHAVRDVSFHITASEMVGVVGESGSGKSATALAVLRLLPKHAGRIDAGVIMFEGRDLAQLDERSLLAVRGRRIAMIPQEPMTALNPTLTIARQLWLIQRARGHVRAAARAAAAAQLQLMGFNDPERILDSHPFQLSGGQRQRVLIAAAFLNNPALIIADEPTTALDVTVQAEILSLLSERARERGVAVMLITHNLGIAWKNCDRLLVMRHGRIVEGGPAREVLREPSHDYTRALLSALPGAGQPRTPLVSGDAT